MNHGKSPKFMASTKSVNKSTVMHRFGNPAAKSSTSSSSLLSLMVRFFAYMVD